MLWRPSCFSKIKEQRIYWIMFMVLQNLFTDVMTAILIKEQWNSNHVDEQTIPCGQSFMLYGKFPLFCVIVGWCSFVPVKIFGGCSDKNKRKRSNNIHNGNVVFSFHSHFYCIRYYTRRNQTIVLWFSKQGGQSFAQSI